MDHSRRDFFKKSAVLATAACVAGVPSPLAAFPATQKKRAKAKRLLMIALDGISVPGFLKAKTPNLDAMLADGVLSLDTRVVMPSVTLPN